MKQAVDVPCRLLTKLFLLLPAPLGFRPSVGVWGRREVVGDMGGWRGMERLLSVVDGRKCQFQSRIVLKQGMRDVASVAFKTN